MTFTTPSCPLLERTLQLVGAAPRHLSYAEMARNSGVSPAWVGAFAKGSIKNPGIITVQRLHDFLISVGNQ